VARLLVLGAGPAQLGVLAAARRRGLTVVAADRDPSAPGFRYADRRAIVSIEDEPAVDRLARAEGVDGIVAPGSDHAVAIAARIASRLGLPHPVSPDTATLAVSIPKQRQRLAEAGIVQPRSIACRTPAEAAEAATALGYPVVVADRLVRDADELAAVTAFPEPCLVEELLGGRLLTVNGFSLGGRLVPLTVTDREQAPQPAFGVPLAHLWPAELEQEQLEAAIATVSAAAEALGVEHGPTTSQVLLAADGPLLAKLSARVGGGHDAELCRLALGVDASALSVAAALGEEIGERELAPVLRAGGACVRFLVAPPGRLADVRGIAAALACAGVRSIRVYRQPGHVFGELRRASDRAGAVLATGDTRAAALAAADAAAAAIEFLSEPLEAVA
jgi:biotin carboxylase